MVRFADKGFTFAADVYLIFQGIGNELGAELSKTHASCTSSIGKKRCCRHARNGVRFQNPKISFGILDEVTTRNTAALKRLMGGNRKLRSALGIFFG